ncbi:MAG: alpha-E domain-containing protein [Dehalococcoidia bacterium]
MLSRVADSLYWMARYIERAENTARFIDVSLQMSLDAPITFSEQWEPLIAITGDVTAFKERYDSAGRENVVRFLTLDRTNPNSIVSCVMSARENARSVREVISSEVWEQVNAFYLLVSGPGAEHRAMTDSYSFFADIKRFSHLIDGVADNTMSHGEAWNFMELGRMIERADNTSRLLDVKYFLLLPSADDVGGAIDEMQWSILLRSATALEMYRRRHGTITPANVIDFLLLDTEFPRAILYCLLSAEQSLHAVSGTRPGTFSNPAERRLGQLRSELAYSSITEIIRRGLHEFLDNFQSQLNATGEAISGTFFALQSQGLGRTNGGLSSDLLSGDQSQRWAGRDRGYESDLRQ